MHLKNEDREPKLGILVYQRPWNMDVSNTSDHIQIKIKVPNPSQEPPVCSKAQNQDLDDIYVLCTFKIKIESKKSEHGCIKDQ